MSACSHLSLLVWKKSDLSPYLQRRIMLQVQTRDAWIVVCFGRCGESSAYQNSLGGCMKLAWEPSKDCLQTWGTLQVSIRSSSRAMLKSAKIICQDPLLYLDSFGEQNQPMCLSNNQTQIIRLGSRTSVFDLPQKAVVNKVERRIDPCTKLTLEKIQVINVINIRILSLYSIWNKIQMQFKDKKNKRYVQMDSCFLIWQFFQISFQFCCSWRILYHVPVFCVDVDLLR